MRSSTKAIEVATSTIVLLVVGIIMLVLSISLTYTVFCGAEEYAANVDGQTERSIERQLSSGGMVQIAVNQKTASQDGSFICGREARQTARFALGIQNRNDGNTRDFDVVVNRLSPEINGDLMLAQDEIQVLTPIEASPGETRTVNILVTLPPGGGEEQHAYRVLVNDTTLDEIWGVQRIVVTPS